MKAPKTFTGEDIVEINCHGGTFVLQKVLETVLENGARAAEPGEFTKRAFLNGKIDLSQAEAVIDVIQSQNEYALKSSVSQLKGSVRRKIEEIRKEILYHTAFIETALDDPEHISVDGYGEKLQNTIEKIKKELKKLISSADDGRILKEGIQTVIVGKPNAGKSSLLNVLSGRERAIAVSYTHLVFCLYWIDFFLYNIDCIIKSFIVLKSGFNFIYSMTDRSMISAAKDDPNGI